MTTLQNMPTFSCDRAGRTKRHAALPALAAAFTALLILGCGGGGSSSSSSAPANPTGPAPSAASKTIAVYAGSAGGKGFVDGPANIAHFGGLAGLVFDDQGNLLVADMDAKAIRKVDAATGETSTWAGSLGREGSMDGYLPDARFASNGYMVKASDGTIYLTDLALGGVRKISPEGMVSTLVGCGGGTQWVDGVGPNVQFNQPMGMALDEAKGYLYVADKYHHVIRRVNVISTETITLAGVPITTWDGVPSTVDGTFEEARFFNPRALLGPVDGALYVGCDDSIRKVDLAKRTVTTVAGTPNVQGFADGVGRGARFNAISGLALDGRGHLLITEGGYTNSMCGQVLRSLDLASGQVTTLAGTGAEIKVEWTDVPVGLGGWADGIGGKVRFDMPFDILVDPAKNVGYISETWNTLIRKIDFGTGQVSTLAGTAPRQGAADGKALEEASFNQPFALAVDAQGNTYVADTYNHVVRKITPQGVVSTLAGQAGVDGCDNGPGASATFNYPSDIAVDAKGNVFVADLVNCCIREITPDGTVSIFAGDPENPGWADGPGATAQFVYPQGLVLGPDGNLYVADTGNSVIRMITPDGTVSTYAGTGNRALTDGMGLEAEFNQPYGITKDASGHLLVADTANRAIRSIDLATGAVTTLAGGKVVGALDGDGDSARFAMPIRIVADPRGFFLVADNYNHAIRKVTPSGTVTTVVGTLTDGQPSVMGIKLGDLPGQIKYPSGLGIALDGSLLALSDNCVLKITGIE